MWSGISEHTQSFPRQHIGNILTKSGVVVLVFCIQLDTYAWKLQIDYRETGLFRSAGLFRSYTTFSTVIAQVTKIVKLTQLYIYDIPIGHV